MVVWDGSEQNKRSLEKGKSRNLIDQSIRIIIYVIIEMIKNYDKGRFGESAIELKVKISKN